MIKAAGTDPMTGRKTVYLGLSFGNLERFYRKPLDSYIRIEGAEFGLDVDVLIFSGPTEADMAAALTEGIGLETKVTISERSKN